MSARYERDAELSEIHFGRKGAAIEQLMTQSGDDHFKALTELRAQTTRSTRGRVFETSKSQVAAAGM